MHDTCNMAIRGHPDLPDMYALGPRAYISGKSPMAMLQPLHMYVIVYVVVTTIMCPCCA